MASRNYRYAHAEGDTSCCFSENGQFIITCGSEGDVRVWQDDEDPREICVGEKNFALIQKGGKLYIGSDNNVKIFTFPDLEPDGILTRFTAPVTDISAASDGNFIAVSSADMEIHLIDVDSMKTTCFLGHVGPVLSVTLDPKFEYLASSSCDGFVKVWEISGQNVCKEWANVIKPCNSVYSSQTLCGLSWQASSGRLLAVPFQTDIKLFQRSTWNVMATLSTDANSMSISLTRWSIDGKHLAASCVGGKILVWNMVLSSKCCDSPGKGENICSLAWNPCPEKRQLAYCDTTGQLVVFNDCYQNPNHFSKEDEDFIEVADEFKEGGGVSKGMEDEEDDAISLEKIKAESEFHNIMEDEARSIFSDKNDDRERSYSPPVACELKLQPSFQPTATPEHLQRRFMVFNDVGYVRQTNIDDENQIDVDFHNASIHHAFRINNILEHSMAALSESVLALCCQKKDESNSKLVCILLKSGDSNKEWSVEMGDDESVVAVAAADIFVAVVTNCHFLRLFTPSGLQREILSLPGPVLSMSAFQKRLFIVCHTSRGVSVNSHVDFGIYSVEENKVEMITLWQPLTCSPEASFRWIGFSDHGNACSLDSVGCARIFIPRSNTWQPICYVDQRVRKKYVIQLRGSSNHYFVIGVSEARRNIRCILCKGSYYPTTTPHPFITEIAWQIPVCEVSIGKGELEEQLWRNKIAVNAMEEDAPEMDKEFSTAVLKLIALCCQTNHMSRVVDICKVTNSKRMTEMAIKYATKSANSALARQLSHFLQSQMKGNFESSQGINLDKLNENLSQKRIQCGNSQQEQEKALDENDSCRKSLIFEAKLKKLNSQEELVQTRKFNPFKKKISGNGAVADGDESHKSAFGSFETWFLKNKLKFMREYPLRNETDLKEIALKRYSALNEDNSVCSEASSSPCFESEKTESDFFIKKKRKLQEQEQSATADTGKKVASNRLQQFIKRT